MFQPLKGLEHSKRYIKDKQYREQYKQWEQQQTEKMNTVLSQYHTCTIKTDFLTYIISPSFYDKTYQITDFDHNMQPLGHRTYHTLAELIHDNIKILKGQITEYINKEETA
jgi:hypothetical protein